MGSFFDNVFNGDTLTGAGGGALAGAATGNPYMIAGGAALGGYAGYQKHKSAEDQKKRIDQARAGLDQNAAQMYAQRKADLAQALGYFAPVDEYLQRRYQSQPPPMGPPVQRGRTPAGG